MWKAVVFDLDGTLTDTLGDIAAAMNRALRIHGLQEHDVDAYRYMVGDGVVTLARRAVGEDRDDLAEDVRKTYQAWYGQHSLDTTKPYEGVKEMLTSLQEAGKYLCVFSNKPQTDTEKVVAHFFPEIHFSVVRGGRSDTPVKPDPTGALLSAEAMGVKPAECLYLGDSNVDMQCAVHAGMTPIGAGWGFRTPEELIENGAETVLTHPMELVAYIKGKE